MRGHSAVTDDEETLGERVFMLLLVALFAAVGALLVILLLLRVAGGVVDLEHAVEPRQSVPVHHGLEHRDDASQDLV